MKTILVTAIGSFSADIVIKNMRKNGYRIIGTDIYPNTWVVDAANVDKFYQVPKVNYEDAYFNSILNICDTENVTHIFPLTDVEIDFYNVKRSYFDNREICLCISSEKAINICRNKKTQQEFIDHNLPDVITIPSYYAKECNNPPFDYPIIAKPYDGRSSIGLNIIETVEDWNRFIKTVEINKYIIQPHISGDVVTVDVVCDGNTIVAIPRLELLRTMNGAGTSVKVFPDHELETTCKQLAKGIGVLGCVNFEFILDHDGRYHYIECNPRFSGGVEFSCLAGYDCVSNHIKCFESEHIDSFELKNTYYMARKYEEYVTKIE